MEIISPFPLDSSLNLSLSSDRDFAVPISGPPSASDSFSASSSSYGPFTPISGRSTPLTRHTLDSSCPQNVYFDMNPLPTYTAGSLSPEYKSDMSRVGYLGACIPDSLPVRQSVPTTMGYSDYVEMSMSQTYSTSAPVDPPAYDMYPMADRYRARPMDSPVAASTVCMSDMCNSEPYDLNGAVIGRPSLSSMTASSGGDHFRGSDTESVGSHSVLSPIETIPSPELPQRLSMVNIGYRTSGSKRGDAVSAGRGGNMNQALTSPSGSDDKDRLGFVEVKTIKPSENTCKVAGCNKSFNRKEHLKRHERATHEEVRYECPFCQEKRDKPFNRWDNFKHHVKMHASRRNQGRVEFHPDAVGYYSQMVQNTRPRTQRRGMPVGRRAGAHRLKRSAPMPLAGLHDTM